jgi:hypothetical protein
MPDTSYVIEILPAQPGQPGARPLSTLANTSIKSADGNATATVSAADIANYEQNHGPATANTFVTVSLIPQDMGSSKAPPKDMGGSKTLPKDMGGSKTLPKDMGGSKDSTA